MSGSEYKKYEKLEEGDMLTMPGRVEVERSLHRVLIHMTGLGVSQKASPFRLASPTSVAGVITTDGICVDL